MIENLLENLFCVICFFAQQKVQKNVNFKNYINGAGWLQEQNNLQSFGKI